jgi:hypothetical protein
MKNTNIRSIYLSKAIQFKVFIKYAIYKESIGVLDLKMILFLNLLNNLYLYYILY